MKENNFSQVQKLLFLTLLLLAFINISFSQKESISTSVFLLANLVDVEENTNFNLFKV